MSDRIPRKYYTYQQFNSDEAELWDRKMVKALNKVNKKKPIFAYNANDYGKLIEIGVDAVTGEQDTIDTEEDAIDEELKRLREEVIREKRLIEIYEHRGLDKFAEWCETRSITDWHATLERYSSHLFQTARVPTWSERAREWLHKLLSDHQSKPTTLVKAVAVTDGIIDQDHFDRDWAKLRILAHREGFTSKERVGEWKAD